MSKEVIYFGCQKASHCTGGQKLVVIVMPKPEPESEPEPEPDWSSTSGCQQALSKMCPDWKTQGEDDCTACAQQNKQQFFVTEPCTGSIWEDAKKNKWTEKKCHWSRKTVET